MIVKLLAGWLAGWMDGWMVGWLDGWLDGWMAKLLDGYLSNIGHPEAWPPIVPYTVHRPRHR